MRLANTSIFKCFLTTIVCLSPDAVSAQQVLNTREDRVQFQAQELTTSKFGGWVFQVGNTPRIVWRDVVEVQRIGGDLSFQTRWFDASLNEHPEPIASGRWLAWIEGKAPNGTPFRRSFTFYAFPKKLDNGFVPDLTVEFPKFPGPNAPPAWNEHRFEFDRIGKEMMIRALLDSEKGAILIAGIAESKPLGRPKRYVESTSVANGDVHLALKLKLLGLEDKVRDLKVPTIRSTPAVSLRDGTPNEAGVPPDAKQKIDQFCQAWAESTGEPFVTLVARRGVIITHQAFGHDDSGAPLNLDYRCWVASITKTITALMFSQFVDQQLIELDNPVSSVFPDYPENDKHVPTFRQCLNHTSGLAGFGDFGGMQNPNLENIFLNAIDIVEPGKSFAYTGNGFELVAKAMEIVSGKSAVRLYDEHFFRPLGLGDVVLGNASSGGEFTAMELGIMAQWVANQGSYGDLEFIEPKTFEQLLPKQLDIDGSIETKGLGMVWVRHVRPGADKNSTAPKDQLFSGRTIGHGSFSGCIFFVDLEQQLVITQVRQKFAKADDEWYSRFFQTVAAAIDDK